MEFARLYNQAVLEKKLHEELDKDKIQKELAQGLLYFDGAAKTWVKHPAMANPW